MLRSLPSDQRKRPLAAAGRFMARQLLVLAAGALGLILVPASAPARSLQDTARSAGRVRGSDASVVKGRLSHAMLLAPGSGYYSAHGSAVVRALQHRLAAVGASPGPIDGRYGPLTARAVERFQSAHGLEVDGIAGPITLAALTAPVPAVYPGAGEQLAEGSPSVQALQRRLVSLGYQPGPIDGRYGPLTARAVERFQGAHGLKVDGIVGVRTWQVLGSAGQRQQRPVIYSPPTLRASQPAPQASGHAPELPVTPVLLGLLALGLAMGSLSYARARRARAKARPRAALEIRPVRLPPRWQSPIAPLVAEHQERGR